jgi:hypothetical protein
MMNRFRIATILAVPLTLLTIVSSTVLADKSEQLKRAAREGDLKQVTELLNTGANVNQTDKLPLRYCVWVNNVNLELPARRIGQRWRAPRAPWQGPVDGQGSCPAFL